jgi:GNAT superfamily N-acetyltransferase
MLVLRRVRRRGVGAALLAAAERSALGAGKTLLVLDTASGDAERLYARQGWQRCGSALKVKLCPARGRMSLSMSPAAAFIHPSP